MGPEILTYCPKPVPDARPDQEPTIELQDKEAAAFLLGFWAARQFPGHVPSTFGMIENPKEDTADDSYDDEPDAPKVIWKTDGSIPLALAQKMAAFIEE
jgi:hypothetical protein